MEHPVLEQPEQQSNGALPADRPARILKVVLTLQPRDDAHYRALIALGANGCDPILHTLDAQDLPAILAAIPDLVAQAEAHWVVHPRYPTVPTPPKATAKPRRRRSHLRRHRRHRGLRIPRRRPQVLP